MGEIEEASVTKPKRKIWKIVVPVIVVAILIPSLMYAYAYFALGNALLKEDKIEAAVLAFKTSDQLLPGFSENQLILGWSYLMLDDLNNAKQAFSYALNQQDDFAEAYGGLAIVEVLAENLEAGMELIKKAMAIDDERAQGNSIIVTLKYGWEFGTDPFEARHVEGFDTMREAKDAIRDAIKCECGECKVELTNQRRERREAKAKAQATTARFFYQISLLEQKVRNLKSDHARGDLEKMYLTLNGIRETAQNFMMEVDEKGGE